MHYVFTYAAGPKAIAGQSISEQPAHRAWIKQVHDSQRLVLAGPFADDPGGMAIVAAASQADAVALLSTDPAIVNGTFTASVRALKIIYR